MRLRLRRLVGFRNLCTTEAVTTGPRHSFNTLIEAPVSQEGSHLLCMLKVIALYADFSYAACREHSSGCEKSSEWRKMVWECFIRLSACAAWVSIQSRSVASRVTISLLMLPSHSVPCLDIQKATSQVEYYLCEASSMVSAMSSRGLASCYCLLRRFWYIRALHDRGVSAGDERD